MTIRLGNKIISGGGSSGVPGWTGTLAEYNNLTEIDDNMLYYITDDCLDETNSSYSTSLELGDVGFTALGVNEELNLRRYLNGQVIAMDEFPEFTAKLKHAVSLNSEISVTEAMWQSEVVLSPNGICYKFVIDDDNMTIRLPKYPEYFIAGLSDKTGVAGNGMTLGLTNGTTNTGLAMNSVTSSHWALTTPTANYGTDVGTPISGQGGGYGAMGVTLDPSKSGIEALVDSASEKIRGYYFIQVATGLEQNADITREITLNNPFFLGMYQYFEVEPNNISWLKSEGQWNSAEVYPGMWEWLLEQRNKGLKQTYCWKDASGNLVWTLSETPVVGDIVIGYRPRMIAADITEVAEDFSSFTSISRVTGGSSTWSRVPDGEKNSSDVVSFIEDFAEITVRTASEFGAGTNRDGFSFDYDFIIDHVTNTFRLPIKVKGAAGKAVAGNGLALGLTDGTNNYGMKLDHNNLNGGNQNYFGVATDGYGVNVGQVVDTTRPATYSMSFGITTDPSKSGIETSTEGLHLYFYVGETVQDPTLINVGRITHALSLKTDMGQAAHASMPSDKYIDLTLGASGTSYSAPADGWYYYCNLTTASQYIILAVNSTDLTDETTIRQTAEYCSSDVGTIKGLTVVGFIPVKKGSTVTYIGNVGGADLRFRFIYAEGSK